MSRGLDVLEEVAREVTIFVPYEDIPIQPLDKIDCRIIKFGSKNTVKYADKKDSNGNIIEEGNESVNLRVYLYVYSWFSAKKDSFVPEHAGKVIKTNPPAKWIGGIIALKEKCHENTGDKNDFFKHRILIRREDTDFPGGRYASLKITDNGIDPNYKDDDYNAIVDKPADKRSPRIFFLDRFPDRREKRSAA